MAQSVLRLPEDGTAETRIVVASHNIHIQKTPFTHGGAFKLFPAGYHLAEALGDDYVAIAATNNGCRTTRLRMDPDQPLGFAVGDRPLPPPADGSVEAALTTEAPLAVADLRAARSSVRDAASFQRMRMEDYIVDVPAFDAVAYIPDTSCTADVAEPM